MLYRLLITNVLLSTIILAYGFNGLYLGVTLGETDNKYTPNYLGFNQADIRYQGFSGRYYLGAYFTDNFGVECGYLAVHKIKALDINQQKHEGLVHVRGYSALIKFMFPISTTADNFFVLRFGGTFLRAQPNSVVRQFSNTSYRNPSVSHWRPTIEVGFSKYFFKLMDVGLAMHFIPEHREMPRVLLFGINLSIRFDKNFL